jgi:hypothetical protein
MNIDNLFSKSLLQQALMLVTLSVVTSCSLFIKEPGDIFIVKTPPGYSEGKNSGLAFKVNGRDFWANYRPIALQNPVSNPMVSFGGKGDNLRINSRYYPNINDRDKSELINIYIPRVLEPGIYPLGKTFFNLISYDDGYGRGQNFDSCNSVALGSNILQSIYERSTWGRGEVHITSILNSPTAQGVGPGPKTISGRFWADILRGPGCDTIHIRDGVFDVAY